jgi:flagellar hook-length control protein FliK
MNIAQINQHQKSQPPNEAKPTEIDSSLIGVFKGQLQFAENDLNMVPPQIAKGDDLRDHHEAIEQKRQEEDLEKSVALSYWNDQNLENRYENALKAKNLGQDLQNDAAREKADTQTQTRENALNQKKLNHDLGQERILKTKPFVISSGLQEEGTEMPKQEFAELFKAKQNAETKSTTQASNLAAISELPAEPDQFTQLPNQALNRPLRDSVLAKASLEKSEGTKTPTIQEVSQKSSSTIDQKANKSETLTAMKDGGKQTAKADGFVNELNASLKEGQKAEAKAPAKQLAVKEQELQNQNVRDVTDNIRILLNSGRDTVVIRLNPEHLGKLEIKLKKAGESLTGEFKVDSVEAKKLLTAEFAQLQQDLENQGIKLDQFSVFVKGEENNAFSQNSSSGQHQQDLSPEHQASRPQMNRQDINPVVHQARQQANPESGVRIVV